MVLKNTKHYKQKSECRKNRHSLFVNCLNVVLLHIQRLIINVFLKKYGIIQLTLKERRMCILGVIFHKNPTEESFIIWMDNFPESFHACDMKRFVQFVKTVIEHDAKKWCKYEYFSKRIIEMSPIFDKDKIAYFFAKLNDMIKEHKIQAIPTASLTSGENIIFRRASRGKIFDNLA